MREPLLFSGIARPSVRVIERRKTGRPGTGWGDDPKEEALIVETSGNGRSYQVEHADAWWRDLAEVRIGDDRRVLRFLQMRGDPNGLLAPGKPIITSSWLPLIKALGQAATAWESEQVRVYSSLDEVARADAFPPSAFIPANAEVAAAFLHRMKPEEWKGQLYVAFRGLEAVPVATTLEAYCVAAAASSLRSRLPMRRCAYCSSWFLLHHRTAQWCSPSCRAAKFNNRASPHAFRADEVDHDAPKAKDLR
jgi:hypothetical protein